MFDFIFNFSKMNQDRAKEIIEQMFRMLEWELSDVSIEEIGEGEFYVNVESQDSTLLLGGRNENLIALQHVVKNIFRSQKILEDGEMYKFDVGGYRKKQEDNVLTMAKERAVEVESSGKSAILPPMSAFFRRLVHLFIADEFPALTTASTGVGDYRAVKILKNEGGTDISG
jgi:spoIIIJ-associated protein